MRTRFRALLLLLAAFSTRVYCGTAFLVAPRAPPHRCSGRLLLAAADVLTNDHDGDDDDDDNRWTTLGTIATMSTPWMTLLGERLLDDHDQELEYWRVEKEDSAVVLTLHRNELVFPLPIYRPGVGRSTLDFPGGRVPRRRTADDRPPIDLVPDILRRELNIVDPPVAADSASSKDVVIASVESLNEIGWPINSSFSNQRLFGFCAVLDEGLELDETSVLRFGTSGDEVEKLLSKDGLECLQCRSVLLEWLRIKK